MPRKTRDDSNLDLWDRYLDQLPVVAALLWEDGEATDAAAHAAELIEACFHEAEQLERP
jgi:hypothetical protein